jgi:hypothetical protein
MRGIDKFTVNLKIFKTKSYKFPQFLKSIPHEWNIFWDFVL